MDLQAITPMVLCFNERENIERCLQHLTWARQVIVLDEGSTDGTLAICGKFPNVQVEQMQKGLSLADKCNRGLEKVNTEWILSIDSDYMLTDAFVKQVRELQPSASVTGYQAPFQLAFFGSAIPNTLYPPRSILYRKQAASYGQDGHAHRVRLTGEVHSLTAPIIHDDRKSVVRWFHSQARYASEEAEKITKEKWENLRTQDRLRRMIVVAPPLVGIWTYLVKGMAWHGWGGVYYTLMRICAELMLSLALLDKMLRTRTCNKNPEI